MSARRSTVRVVLDTNILVSAFYGGVPNEAYQKARSHTIVISEAIRTEWLEVMERIKGRLSSPQADAFKRLFVEALTFAEYLVHRAERYIAEEVDYQGKPKSVDSYQWRAHSTRIVHMIHEHLNFRISSAIEGAMKDANKSIA